MDWLDTGEVSNSQDLAGRVGAAWEPLFLHHPYLVYFGQLIINALAL
jgi:hypothetical protein